FSHALLNFNEGTYCLLPLLNNPNIELAEHADYVALLGVPMDLLKRTKCTLEHEAQLLLVLPPFLVLASFDRQSSLAGLERSVQLILPVCWPNVKGDAPGPLQRRG